VLFGRPVQSSDIAASPEMVLRCPSERGSRFGSMVDEGERYGFDNALPDAYAERWFSADCDERAIERWFEGQLQVLGWSRVDGSFRRGPDEEIGLARLGDRFRLHYLVKGRWPDGSDGRRPQ
jgi:hypothetical protein